jgi:hypothetical protein
MVDSWALFTDDFSFLETFPALHTLKLLGSDSGRARTRQFWPMPNNLVVLHISRSNSGYYQSEISKLPQTLQNLEIGWEALAIRIQEEVIFPQSLKTLSLVLSRGASFDLSLVPSSVVSLKMDGLRDALVIQPSKPWKVHFPILEKYSNFIEFHPEMELQELLPQLPQSMNYLDAPISVSPEDTRLVRRLARRFVVFGLMDHLPRSYSLHLPNLMRVRIDSLGLTPIPSVEYLYSETPTLWDTLMLTPNLTRLECYEWSVKSGALLFEMPPKLTHLSIQQVQLNPSTVLTLPRSLTYLSSGFQSEKSFDGLIHLTKLQELDIRYGAGPKNILQLPLTIKSISFQWTVPIELFESGTINHPTLRTIISLNTSSTSEVLALLPQRLTHLQIDIGDILTCQNFSDLPRTLRSLEFRCKEIRMDATGYTNLPNSLTSLCFPIDTRITANPKDIANALPPQISFLQLPGVELHYRKMYPNHTTFDVAL